MSLLLFWKASRFLGCVVRLELTLTSQTYQYTCCVVMMGVFSVAFAHSLDSKMPPLWTVCVA